jgi:uncharacterized membrane protein YeaQ/YmgE (transglycosylase-associated protein family)
MLGIVWQLIVGLIVGVLARLILPGREAFPAGALGWLLTALLGIAGAFIGGMIARAIWADAGYAAGLDHVDPWCDPATSDRPDVVRKSERSGITNFEIKMTKASSIRTRPFHLKDPAA